ncbi:hypothetical protein [Streptomyces sp. VRA16 Mangrove soil]|uniref:hypothetical protein n=1 Tax=Streptomyces sp. VRA16 Mangrove soil TaxID=2817434 RepID=UPI001A9E8639|nr:hypothetical protein [Streptomyces sp. VRA16 Mangrove soil]MBO1331699.1 hypothetical protein [Streptomyces sp. VRA16 Mangrove soil]
MSAGSERRWSLLAREQEFQQLPELRRQAEGWRNGLAGLASLLAVLVTLKGRDDLGQLPDGARDVASALVAAAFVLLVGGAVLSVRAAHGRPGDRILLAGQALRRWTESEIVRVTRSLRWAAVCCAGGLLFAAAGVGVAWFTTEPAPDSLVRVTTTTGERCGEFLGSGRGGVRLRVDVQGGTKERVTVPGAAVVAVTPVDRCG